ncbi:MAG: ABC transporter ATP-binding protein [Thermodesulfobacteriota bacterium]
MNGSQTNIIHNRGLVALFRELALAYPGRTALGLVLSTLSGLAEGLGIATLLPLLGVILDPGAASAGGLTQSLLTALAVIGVKPTIGSLLTFIVLVMLLKSGLYLLASTTIGFSAAHVGNDLRTSLTKSLLRARWEHFIHLPPGGLATAVTAEVSRSESAYALICTLMADVIQVAVYGVLALMISWQVTVAAAACGTLIVLLLSGLVRWARRAGVRLTESQRSIAAELVDGVQGIQALKAMGCERLLEPFLNNTIEELRRAQRDYAISTYALIGLQEPVTVVFLAVGIYFTVTVWHVPFDNVMVLGLLFWRTAMRVNILQRNYQQVGGQESGFRSLKSTMDAAEAAEERSSAGKTPSLKQGISLERVTFAYDGSAPVLADVSLTIPTGRFTAIIGASGSGKTTIADLIVGFFEPQSGRVLVDEMPLQQIDLKAWRRMIGYVGQEVTLFHDTVLANVTLGDPSIGHPEAEAALKLAGAWEFVCELEHGVGTVVGELGGKLSGGQRQRIALARALARRPKLLILDEVTTGLDPATEAAICATLKDISRTVTILAISHQPALVDAAELVYRLEHGRIEPLTKS